MTTSLLASTQIFWDGELGRFHFLILGCIFVGVASPSQYGTRLLKEWKRDCPLGIITLIHPVLDNLPIYYMSLSKCPASIAKHIEKLQRDFLWEGKNSKNNNNFLKWASICKPKKEGGLGFEPLKQMNQALLGKWLWRLGEEGDSLWKQVLVAKYGILRNGWGP